MTRLGRLVKVKNTRRKFALENDYYYSTWIKNSKGLIVPVLFTEDQIESARYRAKNNPEDIVPRGIVSIILD